MMNRWVDRDVNGYESSLTVMAVVTLDDHEQDSHYQLPTSSSH